MGIYFNNVELANQKVGSGSTTIYFNNELVAGNSVSDWGSIPQQGLLFELDSTLVDSYPGSGSEWFDRTGNGYNAEIIGATGSAWTWNNSVYTGSRGVFYVDSQQGALISGSSNPGSGFPNLTYNIWTQIPTSSIGGGVVNIWNDSGFTLNYSSGTLRLGTSAGNFDIPSGSQLLNNSLSLITVTELGNINPRVYINGWESILENATGSLDDTDADYKMFVSGAGYISHISQYQRGFLPNDALSYYLTTYPRYYGTAATVPTPYAPSVSTFISASGGTITTSGSFKFHTFNSTDTLTIHQIGSAGLNTIEYLIVGGGGGGGGNTGGGGGAGQVLTGSVTPSATTYTMTVGNGGNPGAGDGTGVSGSSSFAFSGSGINVTAAGGAPGQGRPGAPSAGGNSGNGFTGGGFTDPGSGGGGAGASANGGAGGAGAGTSTGGTGGAGLAFTQFNSSGSSIGYGGGGGGGGYNSAGPGATTFGGANGGFGFSASPSNAPANRGGGGGGGGAGNIPGSAGGSGQIIIKYQYQ